LVTYGPGEKLASGLPLGGIGAGKVEIDNKGKMVNLTIHNNWLFPHAWMRGYHVLVKPDDSEPFFIEYGLPIKKFYVHEPESMTFTGEYPFVTLKAKKGPVTATLEAFSPIIPNNLDDSSLPGFGMTVRVEGSKGGKVAAAWSNIAGYASSWGIGRTNRPVKGGVSFVNPKAFEFDGAKGELCLLGQDPSLTYVQYNLNVRPKVAISEKQWKYTFESDQPWSSIIEGSPFHDDQHEITGQWDDPAGLVLSDYRRDEPVRYAFSWYFTGKWALYPYGHYYHNKWKGAEQVGNYILTDFERLRKQSREWHTSEVRKDLPDWLRDAIINSAYTLTSSAWLDERGRFALIEATKNDPMLGTIGGLCYESGSLPVLKMFPELEKTFLRLLAKAARPDGYIPHDLGIFSFDHATDGTTSPPGWKDLCPVFCMLVYRCYVRTKDEAFLKELYPSMVKAFEWQLAQDKNGDGLPDAEGEADAGFDAISVTGVDSYASSVYIACLSAMREAAKALNKADDAKRFSEMLPQARKSFAKLYNGRYFVGWMGEPDPVGYVFTAGVTGDWWTETLGLEPFTDREKLDSTYEWLLKVNGTASRFCMPNLVHESGRIWDISVQAYSSWPRLVFCLSGIRYKAGDKRWLDVARKEWNTIVNNGLVWDQPSRMDGRTGKPDPETTYLDHYIGSAGIWTFAL
jgi:uncharacterized protein (DUF608 family)